MQASAAAIEWSLLQNQFGCDSLVMLDLTVLTPFETNLTEIICLGDTFWVGTIPAALFQLPTNTVR